MSSVNGSVFDNICPPDRSASQASGLKRIIIIHKTAAQIDFRISRRGCQPGGENGLLWLMLANRCTMNISGNVN